MKETHGPAGEGGKQSLPAGHMLFYSRKALCADDVFNPTGVFFCSLFRNAQLDEPVGEQGMPLIDGFGDLAAGFGQGDVAVLIYQNMPCISQVFHGDADAGLGKCQFIGDVDGTDVAVFLTENQNGFQIIFGRFLDFQSVFLLLSAFEPSYSIT